MKHHTPRGQRPRHTHARRLPRAQSLPRTLVSMAALLAVLIGWSALQSQAHGAPAAAAPDATVAKYRQWIDAMKTERRGPFDAIRWFCKDGQVLEPEPYACADFGGGVQHGRWSERTQQIRDAGWPIANVLIEVEPEAVTGSPEALDQLRMILLEQWLVRFDDGWILRRARGYRGAFQVENERFAARQIVLELLSDKSTIDQDFYTVREAVRLLPLAGNDKTVEDIRARSTQIAEADAAFVPLRNKIHVSPSRDDAQSVRDYAAEQSGDLRSDAMELAEQIDTVYGESNLETTLESLSDARLPGVQLALPDPQSMSLNQPPADRLAAAADLLLDLRPAIAQAQRPQDRLRLLQLSLAAESAVYTAGQALFADNAQPRSRSEWLALVGATLDASHGAGLLAKREWRVQLKELGEGVGRVDAARYRQILRTQARSSLWATRRVRYNFGEALMHFAKLEPLVMEYPVARLRGSPMFVNARILERLSEDAGELIGVQHSVFGTRESGQLEVLNPGAASGILMTDLDAAAASTQPVIVLVPETTPSLPPVAGILTAEAGNALSHVQLLAASLGVPNVVVGPELLAEVRAKVGQPVRLLASPGGVVKLESISAATLAQNRAAQDKATKRALKLPVDKLQLDVRKPIPVAQLTADDSGRTVGPKAAKLGSLMDQFPGYISEGLAIPFGAYRALLDAPMPGSTQTRFEWMQQQYARFEQLRDDPAAYRRARDPFLAEMREFFRTVPLPDGFEADLKAAMRQTFGADGSYGVFVRSDTNVEDLPDFTGAGLNLTVPHVVGEAAIIDAVRDVWASPFTERAFGWRQALVDKPEHVYAAVLLHRSVPAELSGVMITSRDGTAPIRVVVNEGVGGGVEGDSAESIEIDPRTGRVTLLGTATALKRTVLLPEGGIVKQPTSGDTLLLTRARVDALIKLAETAPKNFNLDGQAADIEFGIYDGQLWLFQIRPFVQQQAAAEAAQLDARIAQRLDDPVDLQSPPRRSLP